MVNILKCYLDKYVLIVLILLICIFFVQKYKQRKILRELENDIK